MRVTSVLATCLICDRPTIKTDRQTRHDLCRFCADPRHATAIVAALKREPTTRKAER